MLLEFYFEQQRYYENLYGSNTIVLLMKGSFYEVYSTKDEGKAVEVANVLNFQLAKANKKIEEVSITNPYMAGVPVCSAQKHIGTLVENMYTVVLIDQNEKNVSQRDVAKIYSPGTYVEFNKTTTNSICCIYGEYTDSVIFGISVIDLTIGSCIINEITNGITSKKMEELYRLIEIYNPIEIICAHDNDERVKGLFEIIINNDKKYHNIQVQKVYKKVNYQNEIFKKMFNTKTMISPIEELDLEYYHIARISLTNLLCFCFDHCSDNSKLLKTPKYHQDNDCLVLHNNSLYQLGVLSRGTSEKSLFDIVNHTSTQLGKRLLKMQLVKPFGKCEDIKEVHEKIEILWDKTNDLELNLEQICDIEKLHRKLSLLHIQPNELISLLTSYEAINNLLNLYYIKDIYDNLNQLKESIESTFSLEKCSKYQNINDARDNLCNETSENLMMLIAKYNESKIKLEDECNVLENIIGVKDSIKIESNTKYGIHLYTTITRSKTIQKKSKKYQITNDGANKARICNDTINNVIHKIIQIETDLNPLITKVFYETIEIWYDKHKCFFDSIYEYVADIDVIKSKIMTAKRFGYIKPNVIEGDVSYTNMKKLRHPIIERLDTCTNYVANDVELIDGGILLYGVNGAGKSCYSKAIGLAIVLAQSGHYVPADSMDIVLFNRLYTRISDTDNIYKGHSSFTVEMNELKSIIHYCDKNSIVLGDEVCKGTEDISALAIVASTIKWLIINNSKFVFATHLNKLPEVSLLKKENKLQIKHVAVTCDDSKDIITYTREIKNGLGETLYGLEIAKTLIKNKDFATMAEKCRNEVTKKRSKIVSTKQSKYNSQKFVDKCSIPGCDSIDSLEEHHIVFQSKNDNKKTNMHGTGNLCTLCKKHHNEVHNGSLIIKGWLQTTSGKQLEHNWV
uniref:DNA mismatch repair proteins mutS family domain-containing protein n=1 Tax=viral metagenome TaxID=1070528 RepID=A0A6C0F5Q7_9ZZZZ|tara:strand:+ start:1575 stop:4298 length:2724 start_codon:yes stop_codon:yes gene_type:complete